MNFRALDVVRRSGTATSITKSEQITGILEFVPNTDGTAWLMLPVEALVDAQSEARQRGAVESRPLDRFDRRRREVVFLGKREVRRAVTARVGDVLEVVVRGWGIETVQRVQKVTG